MQYFTMGTWVLVLALAVAWAGTLVGLICIRQSTMSVTAKFRLVWMIAAAVCIGTIGTQVAVTVPMLGLGLPSGVIRYDVPTRTLAVALVTVGVLAGLLVIGDDRKPARLAGGTLIVALSLGLMNYLGLSSLNVQGTTSINLATMAGCSVLFAVAGGGLLWATRLRATLTLVGAWGVYGAAIIAIHYLGLSGLSVQLDPAKAQPDGRDLFTIFIPIFVLSIMLLAVPITAVLVAPDRTGRLQPERRKQPPWQPPQRRRTRTGRTAAPTDHTTTEPVG